MTATAWRAMSLVATTLAAAAALAAGVSSGCAACVETAAGACVPMKCHYTFVAVCLVEALGAFGTLGLVFVKCKMGRRWLAAVGLAAHAAALALMRTGLMGLCGDTSMHCHETALLCTALAAAGALACAVLIALADPRRATLPKRGI
ncbi:DUF4418 family protein [Rubneribacter sp.]